MLVLTFLLTLNIFFGVDDNRFALKYLSSLEMSGIVSTPPPPENLIPMDTPVEQVNTRPAPHATRLNETFALNIQKQLNRAEVNKAVDIRVPSVALLSINSADRYKPNSLVDRYNNPANGAPYALTSPADFTITIPQNLMNGYFTRMAVTQILMPFNWAAVSNSTNGIYINFQPGGAGAVTQYLVTLASSATAAIPGTPSAANLASSLQTAIRAATGSTTFTVVYTTTNISVFTFASGNTDKFYFSRWTSPTGVNAFTLFEVYGMSASQVLATSLQGTFGINTYRTPYIDIVCEQITANQALRDASTTSGAGRTLLSRVYMCNDNASVSSITFTSAGIIFQKTYSVPKQISWPANQPLGGSLRIQLLDAQGYVLTNGANYNDAGGNLGNMCDVNMPDWSMVLQVSEL